MYAQSNDAELMDFIQAGNHDAFAELVERHTAQFFALALRTLQQKTEAEDAIQSVFLKLWQNPHIWNSGKGTKFTTWFYRFVLNHCHDIQRKARSLSYHDFDELVDDCQTTDSEQDGLELSQQQRWQQACLEYAIAQLPAAQKDALNLVTYIGLSQKQAATVLQTSVKAIESLLIRARRSVKATCEQLARERAHGNPMLQSKRVKL